jgi:hypothetical protein
MSAKHLILPANALIVAHYGTFLRRPMHEMCQTCAQIESDLPALLGEFGSQAISNLFRAWDWLSDYGIRCASNAFCVCALINAHGAFARREMVGTRLAAPD